MKGKFERYKAAFSALPEPLQRQVLIRLGFSMVFMLLFVLVLCMMFDWLTILPFFILSGFSLFSAYMLFRRAVAGDYVVIRGRCVESSVTLVRRRTKSILVEADEHMVQVMMKQRLKRIPDGTSLDIYVANNTQVYDKDGAKLLHSYLAIDVKGGRKKNDKGKRPVSEAEGD